MSVTIDSNKNVIGLETNMPLVFKLNALTAVININKEATEVITT